MKLKIRYIGVDIKRQIDSVETGLLYEYDCMRVFNNENSEIKVFKKLTKCIKHFLDLGIHDIVYYKVNVIKCYSLTSKPYQMLHIISLIV